MRLQQFLTAFVFVVTAQALSMEQVPTLDKETARQLRCLELNIYHEARGESKAGKIAVAMVTLNRMRHKRFPDTVCDVVKQPGQFSWYGNKSTYVKIPLEIRQIAYDVLIEKRYEDNTGGALYFHNRSVRSFDRKMKTQIGNHIFYI